jgi:quinoprotein glucose dehydrogenase
MQQDKRSNPYVTGALIAALGAAMIWPGLQLLLVGGTAYYLVAGVLMLASGVDLIRGATRGFYTFAVLLLLTLIWAVSEAGSDFWSVGSRIWIVGLLSLWLCTPWIRRKLWGDNIPALLSMRTVQVATVASATVLLSMVVDLNSSDVASLPERVIASPQNGDQWDAYGGNKAGTRYAPLNQINRDNVHKLTRAWEAETGHGGSSQRHPTCKLAMAFICARHKTSCWH